MTIKKLTNKSLMIDNQLKPLTVEFQDFSLKLSLGETIIDKPGEYEVSGVAIHSMEVPLETFIEKVNFASARVEHVDIGILSTNNPAVKDFLKDVVNIDILVIVPGLNAEVVKKTISFFEPKVLVILSGESDQEIIKECNLANLVEEKSLKIKDSDIPQGDGIAMRSILLK